MRPKAKTGKMWDGWRTVLVSASGGTGRGCRSQAYWRTYGGAGAVFFERFGSFPLKGADARLWVFSTYLII